MSRYAGLLTLALASLLMQGQLLAFTTEGIIHSGDSQLLQAQPRPSKQSAESLSHTYTVQRNDTVYSIATRHGLIAEQLAVMDGILPPYLISPGQRLRTQLAENMAGSTLPLPTSEPRLVTYSTSATDDQETVLDAPPAFKTVVVQLTSGDQSELSQETSKDDHILLSSSVSKEIKADKKSLTSSLSVKDSFNLNNTYIKKRPGWQSNILSSSHSEWDVDMQLSLLKGLKVSGQFKSSLSDHGNRNSGIFDAGHGYSRMQEHDIDPFGSLDTERSGNLADDGKYFVKLDASGEQGAFGYGTRYLSWSKDFESLGKKPKGVKEDEAGHESWVSWRQGNLKLKTGYSEQWDNVANDPEESRNTDRLIRITPSYTLHDWPYARVSVSYGQGSRQSSMDPAGEQAYSGPLSEISTSFYLAADTMDLNLEASLKESSNDLVDSGSSKTVTYAISGSYYPSDFIYITPDFSISQEEYLKGTREYRYTGTYSSLSLTYQPPEHPYRLNLYTGYDSYKGNDGYTDNNNLNTRLSLDWELKSNRMEQSTLSFEITSDSYTDNIYTDSSTDDVAAGIIWRWTGY